MGRIWKVVAERTATTRITVLVEADDWDQVDDRLSGSETAQRLFDSSQDYEEEIMARRIEYAMPEDIGNLDEIEKGDL